MSNFEINLINKVHVLQSMFLIIEIAISQSKTVLKLSLHFKMTYGISSRTAYRRLNIYFFQLIFLFSLRETSADQQLVETDLQKIVKIWAKPSKPITRWEIKQVHVSSSSIMHVTRSRAYHYILLRFINTKGNKSDVKQDCSSNDHCQISGLCHKYNEYNINTITHRDYEDKRTINYHARFWSHEKLKTLNFFIQFN